MIPSAAAVRQRQYENLLSAAAFLACAADLVVIGGCALLLHGYDHAPHDLDIVPEPSSENLRGLFDRFATLGTIGREPQPTDDALATREILRRATPLGEIDVMLERGRDAYEVLDRRAVSVTVAGRAVRVAALDDVLQLRDRFGKKPVDG